MKSGVQVSVEISAYLREREKRSLIIKKDNKEVLIKNRKKFFFTVFTVIALSGKEIVIENR